MEKASWKHQWYCIIKHLTSSLILLSALGSVLVNAFVPSICKNDPCSAAPIFLNHIEIDSDNNVSANDRVSMLLKINNNGRVPSPNDISQPFIPSTLSHILSTKRDDVVFRTFPSRFRTCSSIMTKTHKLSLLQLSLSQNNVNINEEEDNCTYREKFFSEIKLKATVTWATFVKTFVVFCPTLKVVAISFVAGVTITVGAIFAPIHGTWKKMVEPVTLFQNILVSIDRGYVDNVDSKKLFETGVSAMLKSLDPYTEFEGRERTEELNESISGEYAGVGLIINSVVPKVSTDINPLNVCSKKMHIVNNNDQDTLHTDYIEDVPCDEITQEKKALRKAHEHGVRVVSSFEGYAFDYGIRVGDKILAVDEMRITPGMSAEDVRNMLRGKPGSSVRITFERDGIEGENITVIPRTMVKIRDVKFASLIENREEKIIGYIQLAHFGTNAGHEVRSAIHDLQQSMDVVSGRGQTLQGLILDLRGNPGGLLSSAVDVTSCLVPKDADIVSLKGRGVPDMHYKNRVDPILDHSTKLVVLVDGQTASASEVVSGAVQDLDLGVIVGSDRTFGKGLVQHVAELPYKSSLKYTVAKYYTPSGRCIQNTHYKDGGGPTTDNARYQSKSIAKIDNKTYYTKNGREMKGGGGIEADYKIEAPTTSLLEVSLLKSGIMNDFASEWSKNHQFTNNFKVEDAIYKEFQNFVMEKQKSGDIALENIYNPPILNLRKLLKLSGYKGSSKELEVLQTSIVNEMQEDFHKYHNDIKENIESAILARYLPEAKLIERSLETDKQVIGAMKLLSSDDEFDKLLAGHHHIL